MSGRGTVLYLDQLVGQGQVHPTNVKITAIAEFPVPSTRRELRRFFGIAGYYHRSCKNFSSVATFLTALTSPSKPFVWSGKCQQLFDSLKGLLCCTPVRSAPVDKHQLKYSTIEKETLALACSTAF